MTVENTPTVEFKHEELVQLIETAIDDAKGKEVTTIDLKGAANFADTMIVASGTSTRHVASIARTVADKVKEKFAFKALGIEGEDTAEWVLVDFGDVIVHVMVPATREFYEIEKLWKARPQGQQEQDAE